MRLSNYKKGNLIISCLGLWLAIIGILISTVLVDRNLNNIIVGIAIAIVGISSIVIYLPLAFMKEK